MSMVQHKLSGTLADIVYRIERLERVAVDVEDHWPKLIAVNGQIEIDHWYGLEVTHIRGRLNTDGTQFQPDEAGRIDELTTKFQEEWI